MKRKLGNYFCAGIIWGKFGSRCHSMKDKLEFSYYTEDPFLTNEDREEICHVLNEGSCYVFDWRNENDRTIFYVKEFNG